MYKIVFTKKYKKAIRKLRKSGSFNEEKLREILRLIEQGKTLPARYNDHDLSGDLAQLRECHVLPDLLLLYKLQKGDFTLLLVTIGSHSELFG